MLVLAIKLSKTVTYACVRTEGNAAWTQMGPGGAPLLQNETEEPDLLRQHNQEVNLRPKALRAEAKRMFNVRVRRPKGTKWCLTDVECDSLERR